MTNIWKRSISMFLAVVMVIGMLPVNAFATDGQNSGDPSVTEPVVVETTEATDPVETDPVETDPVETDPVETDPVETDPVETDPIETDPVETDPVETDPVETDPVETDPVETDPVETDPAETEPAIVPMEMTTVEQDWDLATNEELFQMYAEQQLYGTELGFFGSAAGERLNAHDKLVYDKLVPIIKQIANGERASTTIALGQPVDYQGQHYPVEVEMTFTGEVSLDNLVDALMADLPYEMYWYSRRSQISGFTGGDGNPKQITLYFGVNTYYRGSEAYSVDTGKTGAASAAAENAQEIIEQYKNASDYEKLVGYKNEICDLVTYNDDAADDVIPFEQDNNPWHIIYVFDKDPGTNAYDKSTNVVCEGYSKAFQYLCDLTTFKNKSIACYSVSGTMAGGTGAGNHMWNIVTIDGSNYMADVTNSDDGSVGMDGTLFLTGTEGSIAEGYTFRNTYNQTVCFTYEVTYLNESNETVTESTIAPWGDGEDSILKLSATNYTVPEEDDGEVSEGVILADLQNALNNNAEYTLTEYFEIGSGEQLQIPSGATLTVNANLVIQDGALTVENGGRLAIAENASVTVSGENGSFTAAALTNNGTLFLSDGTASIGSYDGSGKINYFGAASLSEGSVDLVGKDNIRRYYIVTDEASLISALTEEGGEEYADFGVYTNADIKLNQDLEIPGYAEVVIGYMPGEGEYALTIQNGATLLNSGTLRNSNYTALSIVANSQLVNNNDLQNMGKFINASLIVNNGTILNNTVTTPDGMLAGEMTNNGTIFNNGTITNKGRFINNGTLSGNAVEGEGTFEDAGSGEESEDITLEALQEALNSGSYTLEKDFALNEGETLEIPAGSELIVANGVSMENYGTITVKGTLSVENGASFHTYSQMTIPSGGTLALDGYLNNLGTVDSQTGSTLIRNYQIDNRENATFNVYGSYRAEGGSSQFRNFYVEDAEGTVFIGTVNGLGKNNLTLYAESSSASLGGMIGQMDGYREGRFDIRDEMTLAADGENNTLTIPENMIVHVMGSMTVASGMTLTNNGNIAIYDGAVLKVEGGYEGREPAVMGSGQFIKTAPHLTYAWVHDSEEGFYLDEFQENEHLQLTPGDNRRIVFYYNTWNSAKSDWNRQQLYPVNLTFSDNLAAMSFADKAQEDDYYSRIKDGENSTCFLYLEAKADTWNQTGTVTYQGVSFDVFIQRSEQGFYSAPSATDVNWLSDAKVDPLKDEYVFYFILDSDNWELLGTVASGDIWINNGSDKVTVEDYGNGIVKCTVKPEVVANKWSTDDFDFNLGFKVRNRNNYAEVQDWDCGLWIGTQWLGDADASLTINDRGYEYYKDSDKYITWVGVGEPDENGEYHEHQPQIATLPQGVSYDYDSNTLTLNNAQLESMEFGYAWWDENEGKEKHNFRNENLTIQLEDQNSVTSDNRPPLFINNGLNLTITGSGSLNLTGITTEGKVNENGDPWAVEALQITEDTTLTIAGNAKVTAKVIGKNHRQDNGEQWFIAAMRGDNGTLTLKDNATLTTILPEDARESGDKRFENSDGTGDYRGGYRGLEWFSSVLVQDNATLNTSEICVEYGNSFTQTGGTVNINAVGYNCDIENWENDVLVDTVPYGHFGYTGLRNGGGSVVISGGTLNINVKPTDEEHASDSWFNGIQLDGGELVLTGEANININGRYSGNAIALQNGANLIHSGSFLTVSTDTEAPFSAVDVSGDSTADFSGGIIHADGADFCLNGEVTWNGAELHSSEMNFNADGQFTMSFGEIYLDQQSVFICRGMTTMEGGKIDLSNSTMVVENGFQMNDGTIVIENTEKKLPFSSGLFVKGYFAIGGEEADGNPQISIATQDMICILTEGTFHQMGGRVDLVSAEYPAYVNTNKTSLFGGEMSANGGNIGFVSGYRPEMEQGVLITDEFVLNTSGELVGFMVEGPTYWNGGQVNAQVKGDANASMPLPFAVWVHEVVPEEVGSNVSFLEINGGNHILKAMDFANTESYSKGLGIADAPVVFNGGTVEIDAEMAIYSVSDSKDTNNINGNLNVYSLDSQQYLNIMSREFTETTEIAGDWLHSVYEDEQDLVYAGHVLLNVNETMSQDEFEAAMNALDEHDTLWLEKSVTISRDLELTHSVIVPEGICLNVTNNATLTIPVDTLLKAEEKGRVIVDDGSKIQNYGTIENCHGLIKIGEGGYIPVASENTRACIRNYFYHLDGETYWVSDTIGVDNKYIEMVGHVDSEKQIHDAIFLFSGKGYGLVDIGPDHVTLTEDLIIPEDVNINIGGRYEEDGTVTGNHLIIAAGVSVTVNGGLNADFAASDINVNGTLTVNGSMFICDGGTLFVTGRLINNGAIHIGLWTNSDIHEYAGKLTIYGIMENYGYLNNNGPVNVYGRLTNATRYVEDGEPYQGFMEISDAVNIYGTLENCNWITIGHELSEGVEPQDVKTAYLNVCRDGELYNSRKSDEDAEKDHGNAYGSIEIMDVAQLVVDGELYNNAVIHGRPSTGTGICINGRLINNYHVEIGGFGKIVAANNGVLENNYQVWTLTADAAIDLTEGGYVRGSFDADGEDVPAILMAMYEVRMNETEGEEGTYDAVADIRGVDNSVVMLNCDAYDYETVKRMEEFFHNNGYERYQLWINADMTIPEGETFAIPQEGNAIIVKTEDKDAMLRVDGTLTVEGLLDVWGTLDIGKTGVVGSIGTIDAIEGSVIINRGHIEHVLYADLRVGGEYHQEEGATLQLNMVDGETGSVTGNVDHSQMTLFTPIYSNASPMGNAVQQLRKFIGMVQEGGYRDGIVVLETDLTVNVELIIPDNITVHVGMDSENSEDVTVGSITVPQDARLIANGDVFIHNGSSLICDGMYIQGNNQMIAHDGAVVNVNGTLGGGDYAEMTIEEGAVLNNDGYISCGRMHLAVYGEYNPTAGAVMEVPYIHNGDVHYIGTVENLDNSYVTLFHPIREAFPDHDEDTVAEMFDAVSNDGYKNGMIQINGMELVLTKNLTIPENVEVYVRGNRYLDENGEEVTMYSTLTINAGVTLTNNGRLIVTNYGFLNVYGTIIGNKPENDGMEAGPVADFGQLKTMIALGETFIEISGHVIATDDFTIPSDVTVRVVQGGKLEIASGVTVNLNGQIWTSRDGGELIVRSDAEITGGTIMVRTGSVTNQGVIDSTLVNISYAKNQTELLSAVNSGVDVVHVVGNYSLTKSMTIPEGTLVLVDEGSTLTINTTGTITNYGTVQVLGTLKYIKGKLAGNRIGTEDMGTLIGLPEGYYYTFGTPVTSFTVGADTLEAPAGTEVEVYVNDFAPLHAEDFAIVPVDAEDPHVKQTEDGRWMLTSDEVGEVTVAFMAVDGNGNAINDVTAEITVNFYKQHIEVFYGNGALLENNVMPLLPYGQYIPFYATIMDGPSDKEDHTNDEPSNKTGTATEWKVIKGADFVTLTQKNGLWNVAAKNVTEIQEVLLEVSAADGSAEKREIQINVVPVVQKIDIMHGGQSVSGKTIKNDNLTNRYMTFNVVNSPAEAIGNAAWMLSDTSAAHFVDGEKNPIYAIDENGEYTDQYANFAYGVDCVIEFTDVKTVKLTAITNDASGKSATVTILATEMPTELVPENPATSLIGGQSATYQVRGSYWNPETEEYELRNVLTTGITWNLVDKDHRPIDTHPYATLTVAGKLTTKAVADKETIYLHAHLDGAGEESDLYLPVHLYPAVTKVDVVNNGNVITGQTVMCDLGLADTLPEIIAELNVYPYSDAVKTVTWTSSNTAIAEVIPDEEYPLNAMVVPGTKVGTATITATITAWNNTKKTVTFKAKFDTLTADISVAIGATNSTDAIAIDENNQVTGLRSGKYVTLTGTAKTAINKDLTTGVTWALENAADKSYLTVTSAGKLTANTVYHPTCVNVVASSKDGAYSETVTVEILPKLDTALYLWTLNAEDEERNYVTKTTLLSEADSEGMKTIELHANAAEDETLTWTSSKPAVATVDQETGVVYVLTAGTATITAKATNAAGESRSATVNVKGTKISYFTEITDKKGNAEGLVVASGKTIDLVGTVTFSDGSTNKVVSWSVAEDSAAYAKISSAGRLTATANLTDPVTVEVRAAAADGMSDTATAYVTILPLANAVTISGPFGDNKAMTDVTNLTKVWNMGAEDMANPSSYENTMISLSAKVTAITSEATASQDVKWTSSSTVVATVDAATGEVTCLKAGTTTITATAQDGSGKKASFKLTVVKNMLNITLDAGTAAVAGGKKLTIKADVFPVDTTNKKLTWSLVPNEDGTDNTVYATISTSGVLTAKAVTAPMVVTVQAAATDGSGVVATIPVTIYPLTTSVQLQNELGENVTGKTVYVSADGVLNLKAIAAPELAMNAYSWTTSNAKYATVDENGTVHGVAAGKTATITATALDGSGKKATVKVTVINPVTNIQLADDLIIAGTKSLKLANYVTFEPENPTIKTLKWEIVGDGSAYATINASTGELKAKAIEVEQTVMVQATTTATADGAEIVATAYVTLYPLTTKLDIQQVAEDNTRTTVTGKTLTVYVGQSLALHGLTTPAGASQYWTWTSSNTAYAEVDPSGVVNAVKGGKTVTITAAAQDGSGKKATVNIKTVQLMEDLTFSAPTYDLAEGKSLTLKPTAYPSDTANKALTWEIVPGEYSAYATVSTTGVVKAKSIANVEDGIIPTVTVRATAKDGSGVAKECVVRIYPLTKSMVITGNGDNKLYVNTVEGTVTGTMALGVNTTPTTASQTWTWISSNNAIATVDTNGVVTAKQAGKTVTITAKATDGSGKSASVKIQTIQLMTGLEITGSANVLGSGKSLTLKTAVEPATTTNKAVTWTVLPSEDGNTYATISTSGVLKAKTVAEATKVEVKAIAKDGSGTFATYAVTLYPVTTKLQIQNELGENVTGKTLEVKMTGNSEDGFISETLDLDGLTTPANACQEWTWTSSNSSQVAVDSATGVVTGMIPGKTVTITAKATDGSGKSATVKVKTIQLMAGLEITNENPVLASGKSLTLKTAVEPATTTNKAVTWEVLPNGDVTYATVSSTGVLKAKTVTEETVVTVRATAKDGSGTYAECDVYLYPVTTKLQLETMIEGETVNVSGKTITLYVRQGTDAAIDQPNDTMDLTVLTTPANACQNWTFSSSASGYAAVNENGRIEAVKGGKTVTITAKATDGTGKTATVKIKTVQLMTGLEILDQNKLHVAGGKSITLKTSVSPSNTANKKLTWKVTEGEEYATVSSAGVLTAKTVDSETTVTVEATAQDGSGTTATCEVTIYPAVTTKVSIIPVQGDAATVQKVDVGSAITLGAVSFPEASAAQVWTWTSSSSKLATVNADGTVTGIKAGTVTITCKAVDGSGKSATIKVQVVNPAT